MRPDDDLGPPCAVLACADEADVARALAYARDRGLPFTPRRAPERSTSDRLVIGLSGLDAIEVGDGVVEVGAGVTVGALADRLAEDGLVAPVDRCREAGVVGSVLRGGGGVLGRYYGLAADHLLSARVLLADGRIVRARADEHPDLFWGLRAAGAGAFGVVLSVRLRTRPAVRATAVEARWDADCAAAVVDAWQHIAPSADRAVDLGLTVVAGDAEPPVAVARGVVVGTAVDAEDVLSGFIARAGVPVQPAFTELAPGRCAHPALRPTKAEFFAAPLPPVVSTALTDHLVRAGHGPRHLEFRPWGDERHFLLAHATTGRGWAERSWAIAHPHGTGRAPRFHPDPDLSAAAYFGDALPRLRAIKRHYDPADVFVPSLW